MIGAFIIPYFCIYFLIGTPLFFLEMSLGQFTSSGSAAAFKMSRLFKGESSFDRLPRMISIVSLLVRTRLGHGGEFLSRLDLLQCDHRLVFVLFLCFLSSDAPMG